MAIINEKEIVENVENTALPNKRFGQTAKIKPIDAIKNKVIDLMQKELKSMATRYSTKIEKLFITKQVDNILISFKMDISFKDLSKLHTLYFKISFNRDNFIVGEYEVYANAFAYNENYLMLKIERVE